MNTDDLIRFWSRVDKTPNTNNCWEWKNPTHPFGYGRFGVAGRNYLAHRLSYQIHYGSITSKDCVLHKCDNPRCVNPQHLFIGSRADNAIDRTLKGRTLRGSQVPTSKFTEQQIQDIKYSNLSIQELCIKYRAGYGTIWSIRKGYNWRHI